MQGGPDQTNDTSSAQPEFSEEPGATLPLAAPPEKLARAIANSFFATYHERTWSDSSTDGELDADDFDAPDPSSRDHWHGDITLLANYLSNVPVRERVALELLFDIGLKPSEAAGIMKIESGKLGPHIENIARICTNIFEHRGEGPEDLRNRTRWALLAQSGFDAPVSGIVGLRFALEAIPNLAPTSTTISLFADSPKFFREFFASEDESIVRFQNTLLRRHGGFVLSEFDQVSKKHLADYLREESPNLDQVSANARVAQFLRVRRTRSVMVDGIRKQQVITDYSMDGMARRLVELKVLPTVMPFDASLHREGNRLSRYLDTSIVGALQAQRNFRRYVTMHLQNIDDIERSYSLVDLLNSSRERGCTAPPVEFSAGSIACELIRRGWVSPYLPLDYFPNNHLSLYFEDGVVGAEAARQNREEGKKVWGLGGERKRESKKKPR